MRLAVLGSGSAGNAAILEVQGTRILFDAGLSARQLCQRLEAMGIPPDSLDGILLSHEHSDHTRGLKVFLRKRRVPIYATAQTRECIRDDDEGGIDWRIFQRGHPFTVNGVRIEVCGWHLIVEMPNQTHARLVCAYLHQIHDVVDGFRRASADGAYVWP